MAENLRDIDDLVDNYADPVDSPADRATSKALIKAWFRALRAKDLAALPGMMTEDILVEIPFHESGKTDQASYRIYRGKAQVLEFWATAFKAEGQSFGMSETDFTMTADGARAFLEGRGHLIMEDGKEYRNRYVMRFDIVDGRITHCKEYYNPIQSAYGFGRKVAGQFLLETL